jgi:hypothetical protein
MSFYVHKHNVGIPTILKTIKGDQNKNNEFIGKNND